MTQSKRALHASTVCSQVLLRYVAGRLRLRKLLCEMVENQVTLLLRYVVAQNLEDLIQCFLRSRLALRVWVTDSLIGVVITAQSAQ